MKNKEVKVSESMMGGLNSPSMEELDAHGEIQGSDRLFVETIGQHMDVVIDNVLYERHRNEQESRTSGRLIALVGPSGAGKDTIVNFMTDMGLAKEVRAATNRQRRTSEDDFEAEDKYVWMRPMRGSETVDEYHDALEKEYGLVESAVYNGHFYGVPKQSIDEIILRQGKIGVVVTDNPGAEKIKKYLNGDIRVDIVMISPPDVETIKHRIAGRGNIEERTVEAEDHIYDGATTADYAVINHDGSDGLRDALKAMLYIMAQDNTRATAAKASIRERSDLTIYEDNGTSTFYEFLKASNEKDATADELSACLTESYAGQQHVNFLDVGCGDGSLSSKTISKFLASSNNIAKFSYLGIDPVPLNTRQTIETLELHNPTVDAHVITSRFEDFDFGNAKFDCIVASNLYHVELPDLPRFVHSLRDLLTNNSNGNVFFIYRAADDELVGIKRQCDSLLFDNPRYIGTAEDVMITLANASIPFEEVVTFGSVVNLNLRDVNPEKILEFILNHRISELPKHVKQVVEKYVDDRNGLLTLRQTILRIAP